MTAFLLDLLAPAWPYIIGAIAVVAGLWGKGKLDRRKGAQQAKADRAAADAKETIQAHKERADVEADVARAGDARGQLHDKWKR